MVLQFFNTLTRTTEEFIPLQKDKVHMYSCGPTVYNFVHIGNLRCYIFNDILKRFLKYKGYEVKHVMNITDVDDKTIRDSIAEGKALKDFTEFYTKEFLNDLTTLNIGYSDTTMPKATDYVEDMVKTIEVLREKGFTYEKSGSVYFKISKFKDYGKLACLDLEKLKQNADGRLNESDEYDKEDARDFVLWKAWSEKDGKVFWETTLGKGRPGWHIECSTMSAKLLGDTFDIHTGGEDLIFPHHTNEIAQSECATGKTFVNYWLHNAHLIVNGKKMSKSEGNFYTLRNLLDKGYHPLGIRYALMATHYRQQLNFTFEGIEAGENGFKKMFNTMVALQEIRSQDNETDSSKASDEIKKIILELKTKFDDSMDDDLNISAALGSMFEFLRKVNQLLNDKKITPVDSKALMEGINDVDSVLGLLETFEGNYKINIPEDIKEMAILRQEARQNIDVATSARLRLELKARAYVIEDTKETPEGYRIKSID